jgi:hypothetical protein
LSWAEEDRLLLYCCRTDKDKGTILKIIEVGRENIDWDIFLERAKKNGVSALVYFKLSKNELDLPYIPSDILEELKRDYYQNATKNTLIFEELGKVLRVFREAGLPVIVLKGAALAEKAYGNIALRPMSDIDLLLKDEDLIYTDKQLKKLGYSPADRPVDDVDLSSTYLTTLDYRSSAAEKVQIANEGTLVMAPHHLLIHLSEHALRVTHSLSKLSFLCDIDRTINFYREKLDWNRLTEESIEFNLNRMVYLSLYFSNKFLETQIPQNVLLKQKPERFSLFERIFMNFVSNNEQFPGLSYLVHLKDCLKR